MNEEKLENSSLEREEEDKNIITKPLKLTKKNRKGIKIEYSRFTSPTKRFGMATSICTQNGELTKIYTTFNNYNRTTKIVKIYPGCYYIKVKYNKNGHTTVIYQITSVNSNNKTITLNKVANFREKKWDNTSLLSTLKPAITSTVKKAKQYYYFTSVK